MAFESYAPEQQEMLSDICRFLEGCSGLRIVELTEIELTIVQDADGKSLRLPISDLERVLFRSDVEGATFIQVNFSSGRKILLTSALVGFKPLPNKGLDLSKLPKVVTTPDVLSIFEAIQDSLHDLDAEPREIQVLKRIFDAVIAGGEAVGFDLGVEKSWLRRIPVAFTKSAI